MKISGNTVLITGGATGIGFAMAEAFLKSGMALRHQLSKVGIKVFEVVPPAVDTELNPEGRAQRGNFKVDLKPEEFTAAVMKDLEADVFEIG